MSNYQTSVQRSAIQFALAHRELQQFGQAHDEAVWNGATACTHLCLQFIAWFVQGIHLSLDEVNTQAGMPYKAAKKIPGDLVPRGMRPNEIQTFVSHRHLPYDLVPDAPWSLIASRLRWGPVMYAMRYGSAPEWRGTVYHGVHARAPFAIKAGATQLTGAEDMFHAVLLLALSSDGKQARRKDPNHGSPARPEKPPYDVITASQARQEYEDVKSRLHRSSWALVPTRKVR